MNREADPINTMHFDVRIDGIDVGSFTAFDGLAATYEIRTYAEGGQNGYVHRLPGRLTYTTVKLTRPAGMRTPALTQWFDDVAQGRKADRHTAAVVGLDASRDELVTWNFRDVWPVSYKGPSFAAEGGKVATEVFEFAHNGWTEKHTGGGGQ
jgi:phage tail-like protein